MENPSKSKQRKQPRDRARKVVDERLVTVKEAQELLRVGRTTVFKLISDGALQTVRIGRCLRIRRRSISRFIRDHSTAGAVS